MLSKKSQEVTSHVPLHSIAVLVWNSNDEKMQAPPINEDARAPIISLSQPSEKYAKTCVTELILIPHYRTELNLAASSHSRMVCRAMYALEFVNSITT